MRWNQIVAEDQEYSWTGPVVLGHNIPDWSSEEEHGYSAEYSDGDYAPAQLYFHDGKIRVYFHSEDEHVVNGPEDAEALLKNYGFMRFDGYEEFSARIPTDEALEEAGQYGIGGLDKIPSWDGLPDGGAKPVAVYQNRNGDKCYVYSKKRKFTAVVGGQGFPLADVNKVEVFLMNRGMTKFVGNSNVRI